MMRRVILTVLAAVGVVGLVLFIRNMPGKDLPWSFGAKEAARRQDETAKALKVLKEIDLDLGNKVSMKLVLIPAGRFIMGSSKDEKDYQPGEGPPHEVTINRPFYMGIDTVTRDQYEQVMGKTPTRFVGGINLGKTNPITSVSWEDAVKFCETVSQKTGKIVSLPTEAQWEWACRAGTTTTFFTGDTISTLDATYLGHTVYDGRQRGAWSGKTLPVGSFKPNAFGLRDMQGYIWQWCSDWFDIAYYVNSPKTDPEGPNERKESRILRGGALSSLPLDCRSARRFGYPPTVRYGDIGFRVAVSLDEEQHSP